MSLPSLFRKLLMLDAADGKRKASEEPTTPTPSKRIKESHPSDDDPAPAVKPPVKVIPFPEKVRSWYAHTNAARC